MPVGVVESAGVSMTPTFDSGGLAVYGPGGIDRGDVVVFRDRKTDRYIMHRVVGETTSGYVTQGDVISRTDQSRGRSYVTPSTRVGVVYLVLDKTGVHLPSTA